MERVPHPSYDVSVCPLVLAAPKTSWSRRSLPENPGGVSKRENLVKKKKIELSDQQSFLSSEEILASLSGKGEGKSLSWGNIYRRASPRIADSPTHLLSVLRTTTVPAGL